MRKNTIKKIKNFCIKFEIFTFFIIGIVVYFFYNFEYVTAFGDSMKPSINNGDKLLFNKQEKKYNIGDVVSINIKDKPISKEVNKEINDALNKNNNKNYIQKFFSNNKIKNGKLIKRIIGTPGNILIFPKDITRKHKRIKKYISCNINKIKQNITNNKWEEIKNYKIININFKKFTNKKYCETIKNKYGKGSFIIPYNYVILDNGFFVLGNNRSKSMDSSETFKNINFNKDTKKALEIWKERFKKGKYEIYKKDIIGKLIYKF